MTDIYAFVKFSFVMLSYTIFS